MDFFKNLENRIKKKKITICIVGLGYVGLPLALRCVESGFSVIGLEINKEKIKQLSQKKSYIYDIKNSDIQKVMKSGFSITSDFKKILEVDVILICVPTPLNSYREPDLSFVQNSMVKLSPYLKKNQMISLESTTYPGTTKEIILKKVEEMGFEVGQDFFIGYSPEREDPGNQFFKTQTIPKIVSGYTKTCLQLMITFYSEIVEKVISVSTTKTAEMSKLLENIHRAVNIGLVNEMKIVADKMGIDIYEVIEAASTKPFGFVPYYPGPGLGGHCIPVDPFYLTWKAREFGIHTRFIELSGEVNSLMPHFVIEKIQLALNEREKSVKKSKVLILGVAYKKNVDDTRESPALVILQELQKMGSIISFADPYILNLTIQSLSLHRVEVSKQNLQNSDCVVLVTDHDSFDYPFILKYSSLLVDTRGRYKKEKKVIRA